MENHVTTLQALLTLTPLACETHTISGLGILLLASSLTDLRRRQIPNFLTLPALPIFCGWHAAAGGASLFTGRLLAALLCLGLGFWAWCRQRGQGLGAGDVKLIGVCAAALGLLPTFFVLIFANLFQLLGFAVRWLLQGTLLGNLRALGLWLRLRLLLALGGATQLPPSPSPACLRETLPHAPFLAAGALACALSHALGLLTLR